MIADESRIPIIKLYGCLIVSIQIELSDSLVASLKDDIGSAIERTDAYGLLIDVSGMQLMDSYISRTIQDIAQMGCLMGVETVIVGMSPAVAMTLAEKWVSCNAPQ
ncbi:MAG: STAS domain-containing protein [Polyangiaceae bacterium]